MAPAAKAAFEAQTGIRINMTSFDGSEMLKAKLTAAQNQYDVVIPALTDLHEQIRAGFYQPIDYTKLSYATAQDPTLTHITKKVDPNNRYGVIYSYGITGVAYNAALVKQYLQEDLPANRWELLFNPRYLKKLKNCGVSFLDAPVEVFGMTMHYLGLKPGSNRANDYEEATQYLMGLRPYLTYFDNNRYMDDLAAGNLCVAMAYSGDALRVNRIMRQYNPKAHITFDVPITGAPIWFDMLAIPKSAPHRDAALTFINFMISPKIAALNSNFLQQDNGNIASRADFDPDLKAILKHMDPPIKKLYITYHPPPHLKPLLSKAWFKVKYGL